MKELLFCKDCFLYSKCREIPCVYGGPFLLIDRNTPEGYRVTEENAEKLRKVLYGSETSSS